jgi:hypothetical protein
MGICQIVRIATYKGNRNRLTSEPTSSTKTNLLVQPQAVGIASFSLNQDQTVLIILPNASNKRTDQIPTSKFGVRVPI